MSKNTLLGILVVLALLGLVDSWYLAQSAATQTDLVCDIQGLDGCNIVSQSEYSNIFGIPLADFGLLFYALLLGSVLVSVRFDRPWFYTWLLILTGAGSLASVYFVYVQLGMIGAICIYCVASAIITWLSLLLSISLFRNARREPPPVVP